MVPMREVCSVVLQSNSPSKLQDSSSFSLPGSIGDL